ncbi:MAG TPA: YraN family protein [Acidimicrobiales bacterium]|nr:YraN family protein [Acidimicrobiales bacterium]
MLPCQPPGAGAHRRELGRRGEDLVAAWYEEHGYEVVCRNWRCGAGEIDIVARQGALFVFCEVKTRSSSHFGAPAEAVGPAKQARLRRLATAWFMSRRALAAGTPDRAQAWLRGGPARFDVAAVLGQTVQVIEAAF